MATITGDRLRALRQDLGLSQDDVAKKIGVSRPAYVNYEQGKSRPVRKLKELAALFDVTSDYIMGLSDDPHGTIVPPDGKGFCQHHIFDSKIAASLPRTFNPPADFYDDPEVGKMATELRENPELNALLYASKDLTKEELKNVIELVKSIRKAHGMD